MTEFSLRRRDLLAAAAAAPLAARGAWALDAPAVDATPGSGNWSRAGFNRAMAESGRACTLDDSEFAAIQARKPAALSRIREYLTSRLGHADPDVMRAFAEVPREYYHYVYSDRHAEPGAAYEDTPKPWALGYGSALSDYLGQAYMTQIAHPKPGDVTLEIGTGSGFQSSIFSRIVDQAYSIEIIEPLGHAVDRIWAPLGYGNVHGRVGDGYYGWPEVSGGFDIIMATCAAQYAPPDLFAQLKPNGRMIIPIGQPFKRGQVLYVYTKDARGKVHTRRDMGVFFIPMTGAMMRIPKPAQVIPVAMQTSATVSAPAPAAAPGAAPAPTALPPPVRAVPAPAIQTPPPTPKSAVPSVPGVPTPYYPKPG